MQSFQGCVSDEILANVSGSLCEVCDHGKGIWDVWGQLIPDVDFPENSADVWKDHTYCSSRYLGWTKDTAPSVFLGTLACGGDRTIECWCRDEKRRLLGFDLKQMLSSDWRQISNWEMKDADFRLGCQTGNDKDANFSGQEVAKRFLTDFSLGDAKNKKWPPNVLRKFLAWIFTDFCRFWGVFHRFLLLQCSGLFLSKMMVSKRSEPLRLGTSI